MKTPCGRVKEMLRFLEKGGIIHAEGVKLIKIKSRGTYRVEYVHKRTLRNFHIREFKIRRRAVLDWIEAVNKFEGWDDR